MKKDSGLGLIPRVFIVLLGYLLIFQGLTGFAVAQNRVGEINNIEKPPTGAAVYGQREPVRSVEVYRQTGQTDLGYKELPLSVGDEINVRQGDPKVYRVIVKYDDPTLKLLKLAPGSYVRLIGRDTVQSDQAGFLGWITGKIQATTKYVQAIAPGTQYGIEVNGERSRVFVWEGEVRVTNIGPDPQTVSVKEKQLTETFGAAHPSAPRVPSFDEVKDLVLFGLDLDPVIRGTVTSENMQQRLHEDLIRAQFESQVQRAAVSPQINLANVYLFLGQDEEALKMFDRAEGVSSRPAAIYNGRGVALTRLGRYADAHGAFQQALSRDKESIFYNNLGNLSLAQGEQEIEQALAYFDNAIERDRANAAPYNGRSVAFLMRKDFASAETALSQSLQYKDRAVAHHNLGNVYLLRNDVAAAEDEYAKALRLDPQDTAALNNRGIAHLKQRHYEKAKADFAQAIEANPRDSALRIGLGLAYVGLNQFESAVSAFLDALEPNFADRTAFRNLAYLYLTRAPSRTIVQQRLQEATATANVRARTRLDQFAQFIQTLPGVPAENFNDGFEQFWASTRR